MLTPSFKKIKKGRSISEIVGLFKFYNSPEYGDSVNETSVEIWCVAININAASQQKF